jgi:hypothetical protein
MNSRRRILHLPKPLYGQPIAAGAAWERVASRRGANMPDGLCSAAVHASVGMGQSPLTGGPLHTRAARRPELLVGGAPSARRRPTPGAGGLSARKTHERAPEAQEKGHRHSSEDEPVQAGLETVHRCLGTTARSQFIKMWPNLRPCRP